jgi:replicative DNA helicase
VLADTILGACVSDPVYCADALTRLREDDWSLGWQKAVWRAMVRLSRAGKPVNVVTLSTLLDPYSRDLLNRACGERQNPYQQDYIGVAANWGAARRQLREAGLAAAAALEVRK